jgi:tight adherence protein C
VFLLVVINLLVFASVLVIVATLFRAPIAISEESAFGVEIDNISRQTVFESPTLRPILTPIFMLVRRLNVPGFKRHILKLLLALGNPNQYSPEEYLVLCLLWAAIGAVGTWLGAWAVLGQMSAVGMLLFMALGAFVGFFGTYIWLRERALRRLREIAKRLPYTLDLIAMAMDAGATFYEAATAVIRDEPGDPLNEELGILVREIDFGRSRQDALTHLGQRITVDGLDGIISAVLQAEQLGTPLADVLKLQANLLRMRRSMRAERKAGEAAVKMLVPSMLILMCAVLVIFAPVIVRVIRGTYLE